MNLKSKTYMQGEEFKERQSSFRFFCAQAVEFLKKFHDECQAGWRALFRTPCTIKKQKQLKLNFMRNIKEWASWTPEKNMQLSS